jgi:FKBP-type peptidyl-prolyl cis-trans isomerase
MTNKSRLLTALTLVLLFWLACTPEEEKTAGETMGTPPQKTEKVEVSPERTGEPEAPQEKREALEKSSEKLSYVLGLDVGSSLKDLDTDIDMQRFTKGVEDSLYGREPLLSPEESATVKQGFTDRKEAEEAERAKKLGEKNEKEGKAFLAANRAREGIITTDSGLQYQVLTEGDGPKPRATDRVKARYRGTLLDGSEFDSSFKRREPSVFSLRGVIPGWAEALQLMNVGDKYRIFIPPDLAYGKTGVGRLIGPNATLIFEVELLEIAE